VARASCVFCEIVAGRAPAHVVLDDPVAIAFLDTRPVFDGHVLVVPRHGHVETLLDLEPDKLGPFFLRVQRVARAVEQGLGADGTLVLQNNRVSQSVPHLHVHVVPRHKKDGLRGFLWPRHPYANDEEARAIAGRIRDALPADAN
jgi:histidine triad (HIT) family protein